MSDLDAHARIQELERLLFESQQMARALVGGEIDAVISEGEPTPIMLRVAQERLRTSEQLLRAVFDGALDAMLIADDEGRYVDVNRAACALFGLSKSELVGRRISEFAAEGYVATTTWKQFLQAGRMVGEFPLRRLDGQLRHLDFSAVANVLPGNHLSVLRDVTARVIAERALASTERALRDSEARFRVMVENGREAIWLIDAGGTVLYASPSTARLLELAPSALLGTQASDWVVSDDRASVRQAITSLVQQPAAAHTVELRVSRPDGSIHWLECVGSNMLAEPSVGALVWNIRDANERKIAEAALLESQRSLENAQAVAHLGSWATAGGPDVPIVWSAECARLFGGRVDQPPTVRRFLDAVHPDDRAAVLAARDRATQDHVPYESEHRIVLPSGEVRWVYARAVLEGETEGNDRAAAASESAQGYRVVGVVQDITDRKRVEDELRGSEQRYRRIVNNTSEGIWMYDAAGVTTFMNPRMAGMLGYTVEQAVGRPIFAFMDEVGQRQARSRVEQRKLGLADRGEFRLLRSDGSELWISLHADPLFDASGNFESAIALVTDITERRRAEQTRNHLAAIVESSDDAIISTNLQGTLTSWNRGAEMLLGHSAAEAVGQTVTMLLPPGREAEEKMLMGRLAAGDSIRHHETVRRCKDGTLIDVSVAVSPIRDATGVMVGASKILRSISERRRAEETRNLLAAIVESSDDAIVSRSVDGIVRTWNRGAERLTGYTSDEAVGQPIGIWYPDQREVADQGDAEGTRRFETAILRKDESRVDVSVTTSRITDDTGHPRGVSIIARDISAQRRAQAALRKSEEQLRQSQKMEAVGILAGGVAHDFNNLLSVILSYTTMIVEELNASDPIRADLEEVHKAGLRATQLTKQLLAFSRQQLLEPEVLDLNQVIAGIQRMLERLLREDIRLSLLGAPALGKVHADRGQIEQVLMNLVVNARDAMPEGGNLTIETGDVVIDDSYALDHAGVKPGRYVLLAVSDTGIGMDAATKDRIFEPFFTTKDKSKGTGLGLSTVYGIVQQSGGHIWVYSELARGTTFKVYLPRTDRAAAAVAPQTPLVSVRGTETILLVEDEEQVRTIMRSILRRQGYNVLEAQNGGEAFLLCEQFTAKIHLLLTDVVMPRMSGRQLAERLLQSRPEMRVLYVSGYAENTIVHHGVLDSGIDFLQKPIMPDPFLRKVRQVLDARISLRPTI